MAVREQDLPVTTILIMCLLELVDRCISLKAKHWQSRLMEMNGKQALRQNAGKRAISMCTDINQAATGNVIKQNIFNSF